jgi:hypothetical protein
MKGKKKKSEELAAEVYTEDTEEGNSVPLYAYQLKSVVSRTPEEHSTF